MYSMTHGITQLIQSVFLQWTAFPLEWKGDLEQPPNAADLEFHAEMCASLFGEGILCVLCSLGKLIWVCFALWERYSICALLFREGILCVLCTLEKTFHFWRSRYMCT